MTADEFQATYIPLLVEKAQLMAGFEDDPDQIAFQVAIDAFLIATEPGIAEAWLADPEIAEARSR
jgi:hypothetical protein